MTLQFSCVVFAGKIVELDKIADRIGGMRSLYRAGCRGNEPHRRMVG
jgi:hypothetical protein